MPSNADTTDATPIDDAHAPHRSVPRESADDWQISDGDGPVVATAIHDGHHVRDSLLAIMALREDQRRREEDPLTGALISVGDTQVSVQASRFQMDLNRPRDKAVATDPADTWGLQVWRERPPAAEIEQSLAAYDRFYARIHALLERLIDRWGCVLLLDIHSYNHRRDGPQATPAARADNPQIDLGVTTLDHGRHDGALARFTRALREAPIAGRAPDVRQNVRYADGGHFPESLHARYGSQICAITLEYKKIYMDEWSAQADIAVIEDLRAGLHHAVETIRGEFMPCR